jgi:hypothetical protein
MPMHFAIGPTALLARIINGFNPDGKMEFR